MPQQIAFHKEYDLYFLHYSQFHPEINLLNFKDAIHVVLSKIFNWIGKEILAYLFYRF